MEIESVFREHHALVFRAAYRITGSVADAEDILQTVFLRMLQRDSNSGVVEDMESYLRRAAVNAALDLMRSRQNLRGVPLDEVSPQLVELRPASDREHAAGEIRDWLRLALARLSPRAAEIVALRFFEDRENPEIARLLGTTESTIAVTLHRTRERLREEFRLFMGGSHAVSRRSG